MCRASPKKGVEEGALKDWILQTSLFSLSQQKIAKENDFHAAVLFRGYALSELRMNITACTAAHAELKLKPFVISHRFSAFHAQSSENTIMNPRLEFSQYIHRKKKSAIPYDSHYKNSHVILQYVGRLRKLSVILASTTRPVGPTMRPHLCWCVDHVGFLV